MSFQAVMALLLATPAASSGTAAVVTVRADAQNLLGLGQQLEASGRPDQARQLYDALSQDRDGQVRAEARFRMARLLAAEGRKRDAAVLLRRVVGENPQAAPARLELAGLLAQLGHEELALREL